MKNIMFAGCCILAFFLLTLFRAPQWTYLIPLTGIGYVFVVGLIGFVNSWKRE